MFRKEIRLIGLKRCGKHALINWMLDQRPFRNNTFHTKSKIKKNAIVPFTVNLEQMGSAENVVCTYEDVHMPLLGGKRLLNSKASELVYLLLLRDPFNCFASRLVWPWGKTAGQHLDKKNKDLIVNIWKSNAKEFLGRTKYLPNKILVNYNRWFSNVEYRKEISALMGLEFSDKGLNMVTTHGEGSSFSNTKYDGAAQKMKVLQRYKEVLNDALYRSIFKDKELIKLANAIFKIRPKGL